MWGMSLWGCVPPMQSVTSTMHHYGRIEKTLQKSNNENVADWAQLIMRNPPGIKPQTIICLRHLSTLPSFTLFLSTHRSNFPDLLQNQYQFWRFCRSAPSASIRTRMQSHSRAKESCLRYLWEKADSSPSLCWAPAKSTTATPLQLLVSLDRPFITVCPMSFVCRNMAKNGEGKDTKCPR